MLVYGTLLYLYLCSNYYTQKRLGQYGPVSAHMNEERINFFAEEGIYSIKLWHYYISIINDHLEDDDEQPLYHGSGNRDDSDDDTPLDISHP